MKSFLISFPIQEIFAKKIMQHDKCDNYLEGIEPTSSFKIKRFLGNLLPRLWIKKSHSNSGVFFKDPYQF